MSRNDRAAVAGIGVVSPAGSTISTMWDTLVSARTTLGETIEYPNGVRLVGCRARGFDPMDRYPAHELRRLDRAHQMAMWAADDAISGLEPTQPERTAVVIGVGYGAASFAEHQYDVLAQRGWRAVSPLTIPVVMPNSIAAHLSLRYEYKGPSITVAAACASGAVAIGEALWLLRTDRADRVLCGGVDALHTPAIAAFFSRMDALSARTDDPTAASAPFALGRTGFVLGEGAAMLVLDRDPQHSRHGFVSGYATNNDGHHLVAPEPDGAGAEACMRQALADAHTQPGDVGHVNAHGTGTALNDRAEAKAISRIFGHTTPVIAPKGTIGHLIGGAGAVEAIISLRSLHSQILPPTPNLRADPDLPELHIPAAPVPCTHRCALTNSFAFGGTNASLVLNG